MAAFELIPVIDLMGGLVVHARAGERDRYRPLARSCVAGSAEPAAVVAGLLALHPFRTLYIADLDAIRKQGDHKAPIFALRQRFPALRLWVDAGFAGECGCRRFLAAGLGDLVLGSESQADLRLLELFGEIPAGSVAGLPGRAAAGCRRLFERPDRWPERVIAMTLARVGAGGGPGSGPAARAARVGAGQAALRRGRRARPRRPARSARAGLRRRPGGQRSARRPARRCRPRVLRMTAPTRRRWSAPPGVARSETAARI